MDHPLSLQFLQKAILQLDSGLKEYEANNKNQLLRDGVIQRFEYTYELAWKNFRDARNDTSYAYDEKKAQKVFSRIPEFLEEVQYLYDQLLERTQAK